MSPETNDYIYILGRNPELSFLELKSYLRARDIKYSRLDLYKSDITSFAISNADIGDSDKIIEELGGIIKIAKSMEKLPNKTLSPFKSSEKNEKNNGDSRLKKLEEILMSENFSEEISSGKSETNSIGISFYPLDENSGKNYDLDYLSSYISSIVKNHLTNGYGRKNISTITAKKLKNSNKFHISPSDAIRKGYGEDDLEIILGMTRVSSYLGITDSVYDIGSEVKRGDDIIRPSDWRYAMRPRLAKIMVNISEAKEGDVLLDPFCGIGTILQEAFYNGIDVVGIDINKKAIEYAKMNLRKASQNMKRKDTSNIRVGDARNLLINDESIDAIAAEPYLGPSLRKRPKKREGDQIIRKLAPLYQDSLNEMYRVLKHGSKAAVMAPRIRTSNRYSNLNIRKMAKNSGFDIVSSIIDGENYQVILREIHKLQKR